MLGVGKGHLVEFWTQMHKQRREGEVLLYFGPIRSSVKPESLYNSVSEYLGAEEMEPHIVSQ